MTAAFDELLAWLNSKRKFESGLALYKKYGTNRILIRRFERGGDNDLNRGLLFEQIKDMARTLESNRPKKKRKIQPLLPVSKQNPIIKQAPAYIALENKIIVSNNVLPKAHATSTDDLNDVDFSLLPDKLKKLSTHKGDLYREASRLHRELESCTSFEESAKKCGIIITNMRENDLIYREIRHYLNHKTYLGEHPDLKPKIKEKTPEYLSLPADKLLRAINSHSSSLSKLKKWLTANKTHKKFIEKQAKKTELENLIKKMRTRLNAIQTK